MRVKYLILGMALALLMLIPMVTIPVFAIKPTSPTGAGGAVFQPTILTEDTLYGGGPATTDPAAAYDSASMELMQNAYDSLIIFNGEQCGNIVNSGVSGEYLPGLATQVTVGPPVTAATEGLGASGVSPPYTNFTVYFTIRGTDPATGHGTVPFQTQSYGFTFPQYYLTAQDVAYTFLRDLVHSYSIEGDFWLIMDFALLQDAMYPYNLTSNPAVTPPGYTFGQLIQNSVQYNNTCCWFNIPNVNYAIATNSSIPYTNMFTTPNGAFNLNFWATTGNANLYNIDYILTTLFEVVGQEAWGSIVSYDWTVGWLNPWLYANGYTDVAPGSNSNPIDWTFGPTTYGVPADNDWSNWTMYYMAYDWPPIYDQVLNTNGIGGVVCGTGPYYLSYYDNSAGGEFIMQRFLNYWDGWNNGNSGFGAAWPNTPYPPQPAGDTKPEGYCDTFVVRQVQTAAGISDLLAGACDFDTGLPLDQAGTLFLPNLPYPATSPNIIDDPTVAGIQCTYPEPTLETESFYMNQKILATPANTYGIINGPANSTTANPNTLNFSLNGIPTNFFSDKNLRLAFAYAMNYTFYIQTELLGRAYQPFTCAPDGFAYINPSTPVYSQNLALAEQYMSAAWGGVLNTTGFTIQLLYNEGNAEREALMENLALMINSLGPTGKFNAQAVGVNWMTELYAMGTFVLPDFMIGWLADYAGLQDFIFPYLDSVGLYALETGYSNATADALLHVTAYTNNAAVLTADFNELQLIYYQDVPSVTVMVPIGTGFRRDWVMGAYTNPIYPAVYAYNLWKYNAIPGDVNKDGKVSMADIVDELYAFGSYWGQWATAPIAGFWPLMNARWNFYCDVIGTPQNEWADRKINMGDIVITLEHMFQVDTPTGNPGGAPYWTGAWNETSGWYGITSPAPGPYP
jgi:hypothetical protein